MIITVDGRQAAIKQGTSFTIVSENRRFSGADSYTLNIVFPLAGCPRNIEIFGDLTRWDQSKEARQYECDIHAGRLYRHGMLTVTEVTEQDVKCQFLEGRSLRNYRDDMSTVYIDELPMMYAKTGASNLHLIFKQKVYDDESLASARDTYTNPQLMDKQVYLPWVNNNSGNIQNGWQAPGKWPSGGVELQLSAMTYLVHIFKSVCWAMGYDCDAQAWENSGYRWLLATNTLPAAWEIDDPSRALPHWTVEEFFEQIEWLLDAEIDVDYINKQVSLMFASDYFSTFGEVEIDHVVREFTAQIETESDLDYTDNINIAYEDGGTNIEAYRSNAKYDKHIANGTLYVPHVTLTMYKTYAEAQRAMIYVETTGRYYVWRRIWAFDKGMETDVHGGWIPYVWLQEVSQFCKYFGAGSDKEVKRKLGIVPAWIESVGKQDDGCCIFQDPGDYEDEEENRTQWYGAMLVESESEDSERQTFYDKIYVCYWDGVNRFHGKYLRPVVSRYEWDGYEETEQAFEPRWADGTKFPSLRLSDRVPVARIKPDTKIKIQFISDDMPDARSIFVVRGKRYVCSKITATIDEQGLSRLMSGEFYEME